MRPGDSQLLTCSAVALAADAAANPSWSAPSARRRPVGAFDYAESLGTAIRDLTK